MLNEWSDRVPKHNPKLDPKKKHSVLWILFAVALLVVLAINLR